jgi:two-component system, response regulator PdtaR
MKVLIIDDEPLVRLSLKRALEKAKHEVEEAPDGRSGLEQWERFKPDLVFLDVLMPRLSGPDLLRALTPAVKGETKVILMSAFAGDYDLDKAKSLGADLFIAKPFDDVFEVIRRGEELKSCQTKS